MSFKVNWNSLETDNLSVWTKELLTKALNSGKLPNILASEIQIKDLNFGKIAPNFEILEIGELGRDRFRGIFKINYEGDFHLTLHTKVQANPLNIYYHNSLEKELDGEHFITPNFLLLNEQFALPMDLKLSDIKISGIGIIVFSKAKGLTLVFRNDPLDSIKVSSTFDTVKVLATFLQKQIENQIRDLFRETLPTMIHQMSLNYLDLDDFNSYLMSSSTAASSQDTPSAPLIPSDMVYSSSNLRKNLSLFNSRETLKLNIPRFTNIIQRSHCNTFNKNVPTLLNSLYNSMNKTDETLNVVGVDRSNNGIPIDLLMNENNFNKTDNIIREVASIQGNSFYKNNSDTNAVKPKRRTIKLHKKKEPRKIDIQSITPEPETQDDVSTIQMSPSSSSDNSTLVDEMNERTLSLVSSSVQGNSVHNSPMKSAVHHPRPMRLSKDMCSELIKSYHNKSEEAFSVPTNVAPTTNSGLLNVGLGNSYFAFPTMEPVLTSPIRQEMKIQRKNRNESKSINYIDIDKINSKLLSLRLEKARLEKAAGNRPLGVFDSPPPYYQV